MSGARLLVEACGPLTSVQDRGRFGWQRYGLGPSGALDLAALALANALAGNPAGEAAIECGPLPMTLRVEGGPVRLALAGAARIVKLSARAVPPGETVLAGPGEAVLLGAARGGVVSYLAVEGGLTSPPVMGSRATHARANLGSPYGRALAAGDALPVAAAGPGPERRLTAPPRRAEGPIRLVFGPQDDAFTPAALDALLAADWAVSPKSDRMGFRLDGPRLTHRGGADIVSDGLATGAIQVPANGQPLLLMAERGTTGGYPKIATVISADLGRVAQTPAGTPFRFAAVSVEEAQGVARAAALALARVISAIAPVPRGPPSAEELLRANLVDGVADALA